MTASASFRQSPSGSSQTPNKAQHEHQADSVQRCVRRPETCCTALLARQRTIGRLGKRRRQKSNQAFHCRNRRTVGSDRSEHRVLGIDQRCEQGRRPAEAPHCKSYQTHPGMAGSREKPHSFNLCGATCRCASSGFRHRHDAIVRRLEQIANQRRRLGPDLQCKKPRWQAVIRGEPVQYHGQ